MAVDEGVWIVGSCVTGSGELAMRQSKRLAKSARREPPTALCRRPAHDQPVQARRKGSRVVRDLAIEDLRLVEQQRRKVGRVFVPRIRLCLGQRLYQRVAHVELEDRLRARTAALPAEQTFQLAIGPMTTGDQAGGAVDQTLRGT